MRSAGLALLLCILGLAAALHWTSADGAPAPAGSDAESAAEMADGHEDSGPLLDPLGPNAACYVCHMTFVFEEISRTHLVQNVTCIECHGLSAAHANDENIGATKPDITYPRDKVDRACGKCHEGHDVPARRVAARWIERKLKDPKPVCTDCHGMHRIEDPHGEDEIE